MTKTLTRRVILGGGAALLAVPAARANESIVVAAASDLQLVFPKLADVIQRTTGVSVTPVFGSTGNIARQIRQGAPFEVFLAADESFVEALARDGVIADRGAAYARGQLALITGPSLAAPDLTGLAERARVDRSLRLAIANPEHAPYGQRAIEVLKHQGQYEALQPRLIFGETATQALQFFGTGAVAASLTAKSLLIGWPGKGAVADIPQAWHTPLIQRLAVTRKGGDAARRFAAAMTSAEVQQVLSANGFLPPG